MNRAEVAATPLDAGLFLALAPMDGITDWVWRDLLTGIHGGRSGVSLCVSEFVRVTREVVVPHVLLRHCPEMQHGGRTRHGTPVFVQLLGGSPEPMAETASLAAAMGAAGIDLNFGCPAKVVNNHDGGAALLKTPCRVEAVTQAVRRAVPAHVPVTAKIRLGWDSAAGVEDLARAAEAGGAAWLTIHARTRLQLYRPPVDWVAIGRARQAVSIPVVANGDLFHPADLDACARASGCRAFMIGRGAMARPNLFRRMRGARDPELDLPWMAGLMGAYVEALVGAGAPPQAALGRLKQWLRYGAAEFASIREGFDAIKRMQDVDRALDWLTRWSAEAAA